MNSLEPECAPMTPESTRRSDVAGVPVRLADGGLWTFAYPTIRWRPKFIGDADAGGRIECETYYGYPLDVDAPLIALREAIRADPAGVPVVLILHAAVALLRRAHWLSMVEACTLLEGGPDQLAAIEEGIFTAIRGPVEPAPETPVEHAVDAALEVISGEVA